MGKIVKIALAFIILGVIGVAVFLFNGVGVAKGEKIDVHKQLDAKNIDQLVIETNFIDVMIHPTNEDQVKTQLTGTLSKNKKIDLQTPVNNQALTIIAKQENKFWSPFNFDLGSITNPVKLHVYIPEKKYQSITIKNKFGDIVADQKLVTQKLSLTTEHGDTTLNGVDSEQLTAISQFGDVNLSDVNAPFEIKAEHGNVVLQRLTEVRNKNSVKTEFGDIRIQVTKEPTILNLDFETDFGEIENDFPFKTTHGGNDDPTEDSLKGSIGQTTAESPTLTLKTEHGDIEFKK